MHHFSFARPIALLPASLEAKLATQATLSDDHSLGDPDFAEVASPILDAIANETQGCDNRDVVVCRTRYIVRRQSNGTVRTCGWVTEFGGTAIETHTGLETAKYLDSELNRRLDNFGAR